MPDTTTYEYAVRDRAGKLVTGRLEAANEAALLSRLKGMGYAPVKIKATGQGLQRELTLPGFGSGISLKDLAVMARQFATMISSGLSMLRALSILTEQTENAKLVKILTQVTQEVETGTSLSAALAVHPKVFPPLMVNMVRAGEVGGFLDQVLLQIAANFEAEVKLRAKVKSAMTYPVVVFAIALLAVAGMLLFIVPVFAKMFDDLGAELPAPTQALVFLSAAMKVAAPVGAVVAVVAAAVWQRVKHRDGVRAAVDPLKLRVPIFGPLARKIAISRLTRNLGTMMKAGVPILQSLEIVADTSGNAVVGNAVRDVQQSVRQGRSLAGPLNDHPVFPPMVVQMMAVGEDTGALDDMLGKISDFYDQEVEATTEALTSLIEPIMIALLGGIVGSMIIALYMPIFTVFEAIQ
jgi:type IV pilus assembly protein PilC